MSPHDFALELLEKARADEYAIDRLLDDPAVDNAIIGFHCQQAAEKLLKAVLAEHRIPFTRSHNLTYLIQLLSDSGRRPPPELSDLDTLTPFAVTLRYVALDIGVSFDRRRARQLVQQLRRWVDEQI